MRTRSQKRVYMENVELQRVIKESLVTATAGSPPSPKKRKTSAEPPASPLLLTPQHPKPRTVICQTLKTPQKAATTETTTTKCVGICRALQYASTAATAGDDAQSVLQRVSAGQKLCVNLPIVGRDQEHQTVRTVLQEDAIEGSLFIIGPPGTGKSSSVDELLAEQDYDIVQATTKKKRGINIKTAVKVNCSTFADPAVLYAAVAEQIRRATSWKVPEELDTYLLDAFIVAHRHHKASAKHQAVVVVLDEVDQLLRLPVRMQPIVKEVLGFFVRWSAIAPSHVKFLGIMNGVDMYEQVSRVHAVGDDLSDAQIPRVLFGPYSHENLLVILQRFVQSAMASGSKDLVSTYVESRAIELIARKVASRDGDARRAISLLQQCARHALQRSSSADNADTSQKVTMRDVLQCANAMLSSPIVRQIKQLPRQAKVLLYVITLLAPSNNTDKSGNSSDPTSPKQAVVRCDMNQVSEELARLRGLPQTAWVPRLSREDLQTHLTSLDCYALAKRGAGKRSEQTSRPAATVSARSFWTTKLSSCVTMAEVSRALQDDTPLSQLLM